jgi:NitT/TauT family transport system permease protein
MKRFVHAILIALPPLVILVVVLEWLVRAGVFPAWFLPTPTRVVNSLRTDLRELSSATLHTLAGAAGGFALSLIVGVTLAIILASARWLQRMFYPYVVFLQTVPIIAIAPMLVIWLGIDLKTVVASSFIVSLFPVIANTLAGLNATDPALRDLFRLYRAGPVSTLIKLRLPFALPAVLTGLQISAGLAVVGAIVGEFITGGGIGGVIDVARTQQDVNKIFAALLLGSLLGIVLFGVVNLASRLLLRNWHPSELEPG